MHQQYQNQYPMYSGIPHGKPIIGDQNQLEAAVFEADEADHHVAF